MKKRLSFLKFTVVIAMSGFFSASSFAGRELRLIDDPPVVIIPTPDTPQPIPTISIP